MKAIYNFYPGPSKWDVESITGSVAVAGYPLENLRNYRPGLIYKTPSGGSATVVYKLDPGVSPFDSIYLNRINFSEFYIETSNNNILWTEVAHVTGVTRDELYCADPTTEFEVDNYMHYIINTTDITASYIRLRIPTQTPVFNTDYYQIGNFLIGKSVDIYSPSKGFNIEYINTTQIMEFDSGFIDKYKVGRGKRIFSGNLTNMSKAEYDKIVLSMNPFVLYVDFNNSPQDVYLVRNTLNYSRIYNSIALYATMPFTFEEIV